MPVLQLVVPGANFAGPLGKLGVVPNPRNSLYAAYLLGTDFATNPMQDLGGSGRNLAVAGGGVFGKKSLVCSGSVYATTPFTGREVASSNGELTYIVVAKSPASHQDYLMGDFITDNAVPAVLMTTTTDSPIRVYVNDAGPSANEITGGADAARGTRFEMYACSVTPSQSTIYRGWGDPDSVGAQTHSQALPYTFAALGSPTVHVGIGGAPGETFAAAGSPEIVFAAAYTRALTTLELDAARASLRTILAARGLIL